MKLATITTLVLLVAFASPARADFLGDLVNDAGDLAGNVVKLKKDKVTGENKVEFISVLKPDEPKKPAKKWVNPDQAKPVKKVKRKAKKKTSPSASSKEVAAKAAPVAPSAAPAAVAAVTPPPPAAEPKPVAVVQPAASIPPPAAVTSAPVKPPLAEPAKAPEPQKKKGFVVDF